MCKISEFELAGTTKVDDDVGRVVIISHIRRNISVDSWVTACGEYNRCSKINAWDANNII